MRPHEVVELGVKGDIAAAWFSIFFENPLVRRVQRRIPIRMVRSWYSAQVLPISTRSLVTVLIETLDLRELAALFDSKARAKRIDPAVFPTRFEGRRKKYEERWEREMREHLKDPPRFDDVLRVVRRNLRQAGLI